LAFNNPQVAEAASRSVMMISRSSSRDMTTKAATKTHHHHHHHRVLKQHEQQHEQQQLDCQWQLSPNALPPLNSTALVGLEVRGQGNPTAHRRRGADGGGGVHHLHSVCAWPPSEQGLPSRPSEQGLPDAANGRVHLAPPHTSPASPHIRRRRRASDESMDPDRGGGTGVGRDRGGEDDPGR
jgi:hypothetical protein